MNKNINSPVRILVKDRENINIIYEIICNMSEENKLIGNGTVIDFRTGEILLVNFSTNNIISSNLLKSIPLYKDEDEYNMYNNQTKFIEKKDNIDPANEIIIQKVNEKNEIFSLDEIINDENNLEELENKLNNKFTEKKNKVFWNSRSKTRWRMLVIFSCSKYMYKQCQNIW
jgi:hydroxymethylpyrimidine pyrophosphatase-like HAD family hydrolase